MILFIIFIIAVIFLGIRIFSGEDSWICQEGQWIRHGNPEAEKPKDGCLSKQDQELVIGGYWLCRDGEWTAFGEPKVPKPSEKCGDITEASGNNQQDNEANIIVSNPKKDAIISSPFNVEGRARVFENVVSMRLKDDAGKILFQGNTNAQSPDMGQYGLFKEEIKYSTSQTEGVLEVFEFSAKDGSEINKIVIPVKFGNK